MLALRQSCDRCHEHKVRCIREVPEKTVPCARCTRAETPCIYSIQQKPGRRISSKGSAATRERTVRTSATPLDLISDESKTDVRVSSEEWLHGLDALTESLSPSLNEPATAITTTTAEDASLYFCETPFEPPSMDRVQGHIEQLAALISTVGRSVSSMFSSASRLTLSTSSAPFNVICSSTGSLITIITQLRQLDTPAGDLSDVSMQDLDPVSFDHHHHHHHHLLPTDDRQQQGAGTPAPLSPVTLMMILACYQRLLEAFELICLFMQQRLHELEMCSLVMGPLTSSSPPSETLQFIMMIELTSDLLSRLDRAMTSLVGDVDDHKDGIAEPLGLAGVSRQHLSPDRSSSSSCSSTSSCSNSIGCSSSEDLFDRKGTNNGESQVAGNVLILRAGEQLRQQQHKLRALIKVVKRLVRSQQL